MMKADLEFVSRANTFMQMKIRLEECKAELREKMQKSINANGTWYRLIKEILGVES